MPRAILKKIITIKGEPPTEQWKKKNLSYLGRTALTGLESLLPIEVEIEIKDKE